MVRECFLSVVPRGSSALLGSGPNSRILYVNAATMRDRPPQLLDRPPTTGQTPNYWTDPQLLDRSPTGRQTLNYQANPQLPAKPSITGQCDRNSAVLALAQHFEILAGLKVQNTGRAQKPKSAKYGPDPISISKCPVHKVNERGKCSWHHEWAAQMAQPIEP